MQNEDLTHKVIGCAYKVYNTLGFGFLESVYQKAMLIELSKIEITAIAEAPLKVYYEEQLVGNFSVDILVENDLVVELKSLRHLNKAHEVQLVNYLTALNKDIGLLINFAPNGVKVKRKYR